MKKTNKADNVKLVKRYFENNKKIKELEKQRDEDKITLREMVGADGSCSVGKDFIVNLADGKMSFFNKDAAIKDGIDIDKYYVSKATKPRVSVKKI